MQFSILFSPSEDKVIMHNNLSLQTIPSLHFLESLWQNDILNDHRIHIMQCYYQAILALLQNHDKALLESIYGTKSFHDKILLELHATLDTTPLLYAIERYNGVAFQGLSFATLPQNAKEFILQNVLIFSNLFGVIRAQDSIPFYKLKQGTKAKNLTLKEVYAPFIPLLHNTLQDKAYIIDLRAGIYTKLFMPALPHFFFEFQKNGKVISHYAKLYRGKILHLLAQEPSLSHLNMQQCLEYLCSLHDTLFRFHTYTQQGNRFICKYEIL